MHPAMAQQGREAAALEELAAAAGEFVDDPGELLIREEQEAAFMKLLGRLPVAQRSVLVLHFVEDFPLEEIARITGTALGTVKSRLHYAKLALRKLLEEEME